MKKSFSTYLLTGLLLTFHLTKAFELPNILEKSIADNVIEWSKRSFNVLKQEGICNFIVPYNANWRIIEGASHLHSIGIPGVQFATPLIKNMVGQHYLYRMEVNWLKIFEGTQNRQQKDDHFQDEFTIKKIGFSGRHLTSPNFILGGYLFADWPNKKNSQSLPWILNLGLETIWPRYDKTITGDIIFHPKSFLNPIKGHKNHFYKGSIKFSSLRPQELEVFAALSGTKYAGYDTEWMATLVGIKFQIPINKWSIKRHMNAGGRITYKKESAWISLKNFGLSFYFQVNLLPTHSRNSLQYYLRMPIDRYIATPCHPSQHPHKSLMIADPSPSSPIGLTDNASTLDPSDEPGNASNNELNSAWFMDYSSEHLGKPLQILTPKASRDSLRST